jgi:hypothetical protein
MFDDYSTYPKERVKLFFRYLVNAAGRHSRRKVRDDLLTGFGPDIITRDYVKYKPAVNEPRVVHLSEERKEELETKVDVYYTDNKYLPVELKLKKLRKKVSYLRRDGVSKTKIKKLREQILLCEKILKEIKKSEVSGH